MSEHPSDATDRYAIILIGQDGSQALFESGLSKERAESMQAVLLKFIADVRVVDETYLLKPPAP